MKRFAIFNRPKIWVYFVCTVLMLGLLMENTLAQGGADDPLAVWDFDTHSITTIPNDTTTPLATSLPELLIEQLLTRSTLHVIERSRLREILDEQKLGSSALADEDTRLRLGRLAGAKNMVFGSIMRIGDQARLDVRLVSTETSEVLATSEVSAQVNDLLQKMPEVAGALVSKLEALSVKNRTGAATVSTSDDLNRQFNQGLAQMDHKDYAGAIETFSAILAVSPNFSAAERQIKLALDQLSRQ